MNGPNRKAPARQPAGSLPEQVMAHAQGGREIIQESVPLADSIEWSLGQEYLRQRGNKAFLSDASPVPFVVKNTDILSAKAREAGYAAVCCRDLFIHHFGTRTFAHGAPAA